MESSSNILVQLLEGMDATRWGIIGIGLVGLELATGTTYILWPAAAAFILAIWVFILPIGWEMQLLAFFGLSVVLLVLGHKFIKPLFKSGEPSETNEPARAMLGKRVIAASDFSAGNGRVKVGDTEWKALAETGNPISGAELVIMGVKGTTLVVEPIEI